MDREKRAAVVARVRGLLELAASRAEGGRHEAATAALKAAALIKQHGLLFVGEVASAAEEVLREEERQGRPVRVPTTPSEVEQFAERVIPKMASQVVGAMLSSALSGRRRRR